MRLDGFGLFVDDMPTMVRFYRDVLGFEIKEGETCTEAEIDAFCKDLPRYKRPRKIFFDKVPRNPTGKIEKPVLRDRYCGERLVEAQLKADV